MGTLCKMNERTHKEKAGGGEILIQGLEEAGNDVAAKLVPSDRIKYPKRIIINGQHCM